MRYIVLEVLHMYKTFGETIASLRRAHGMRQQALAEAKAQGIHGKETTPFLLAKVKDLTGGDSLDANIQLVFNNAKLAAQTAVAYCKL